MIRPLDRERLRRDFNAARPFRFAVIDNFLDDSSAQELARAYPSFEDAVRLGFQFKAVNEQKKVQITDAQKFPELVRRFNEAISSPAFLSDLSYITGIPNLLADAQLAGGGMHLTGPGGRLDVHVDFNYLEERKLHRRLNILFYLNPEWNDAWGGHIELWNRDVTRCEHRYTPVLNRCLFFETNDISYHGVAPINDAQAVRRSFAAYYYTAEPPPNWTGVSHSTIFRARPDEKLKGYVLMPLEKLRHLAKEGVRSTKRRIKRWLLGPGAPDRR